MPKRPSRVTSPNTSGAGTPAAKTARIMRASCETVRCGTPAFHSFRTWPGAQAWTSENLPSPIFSPRDPCIALLQMRLLAVKSARCRRADRCNEGDPDRDDRDAAWHVVVRGLADGVRHRGGARSWADDRRGVLLTQTAILLHLSDTRGAWPCKINKSGRKVANAVLRDQLDRLSNAESR